jgi:glycosyltransferase involved in cell wall biosynthesis
MTGIADIKVCFIAGTLGQGGAERQLFYILKVLRQQDTQVRLLCLTSGEFWEDKVRELGVPVEWVGASHSRLGRLRTIVDSLKRDIPDIVQSQHFFVNPYVGAAARFVGSRSIAAVRSDLVSEVYDRDQMIRRWGLKVCRIVAANSKSAMRRAVECGVPDRKLKFLPNVVDTNDFRPDRQGVRPRLFTIASVGRLVQSKRHDRLLSILAKVKSMHAGNVTLLIAGDGPAKADIERDVDARGLRSSVEFLGNCSDLRPVYRRSDALAITSDVEGTPNVLLEAMACGLPVVSTKVGGVPDVITHGVNGLLVDADNESAFAGELVKLHQNAELRESLGAQARLLMERHHSLSRLSRDLEDLYATVLSN